MERDDFSWDAPAAPSGAAKPSRRRAGISGVGQALCALVLLGGIGGGLWSWGPWSGLQGLAELEPVQALALGAAESHDADAGRDETAPSVQEVRAVEAEAPAFVPSGPAEIEPVVLDEPAAFPAPAEAAPQGACAIVWGDGAT